MPPSETSPWGEVARAKPALGAASVRSAGTTVRRSDAVEDFPGNAMAGYYCPRCLKTAPVQKVCCGRPMKKG
jgi:hypothetical protein